MSEGIIAFDELGQYMREHGGEQGACLFERFLELLGQLVHAYVVAWTAERLDEGRIEEQIETLRACAGKIRSEFPDMPCPYMDAQRIEPSIPALVTMYSNAAQNCRLALIMDSESSSVAQGEEQPERADAPTGDGAGS
jgi:hypothetical protein